VARAAFLVAVVVLLAPLASGQEAPAPPAAAEAGRVAYDQGRYAEALADFQAAYAADPKPNLLYAIGQAYRKLGDCPRAIEAYEQFLQSEPAPDPARLARGHIEACRIAARPVEPQPSPPPPPLAAPEVPAGEAPRRLETTASTALPGLGRVAAATPRHPGWAADLTADGAYAHPDADGDGGRARLLAGAALSFTAAPSLAVGVELAGRYERTVTDGGGDGVIGEPRLRIRSGFEAANGVHLAGQLTGWFPAERPADLFDGASLEALLLASLVTEGGVSLHANGGYRLDRSAGSVEMAEWLSPAERAAVGLSELPAVFAGVGADVGLANVTLVAEGTWEILVGERAPDLASSPLCVAAGLRTELGAAGLWIEALLRVRVSREPPLEPPAPLVPVEPRIGLVVGLGWSAPSR